MYPRSPKSQSSAGSRKRSIFKGASKSPGPSDRMTYTSEAETDPKPKLPVKKTAAVVIDTGTGSCKAGFAGEAKPNCIMATVVGYPLEKTLRTENIRDSSYVGKAAWVEPDLRIVEPVHHGIIVDWDAAETLWRHMYYHNLKVPLEEHALLISDPPLSPTTNREKMVEVVFESMNCPGMYVAYQSVLSTYSYGKTGGLVVESGYGVTHTVPVHQGYNLPHATERLDIAGTDLTTHLMKLLQKSGNSFSEKDRHIIEDIKLKCCYVAVDLEGELKLPENEYLVDYQLPDGHIIAIGKERFLCPEELFQPPSMAGIDVMGIHQMALKSMKKVPVEIKKEMYDNILLCGGSSLFNGFYERFSKDFLHFQSHAHKSNILSVPESKYSTWMGGSILASLKSFQSCWIRQEEYRERGPFIVHRRCY
ncbi:actin-1-like [Ascaphus truei]|uniref:actin-1-like n=1 Tax=Ascaphus truei TaxID=8439 RepID=UPI003F599013